MFKGMYTHLLYNDIALFIDDIKQIWAVIRCILFPTIRWYLPGLLIQISADLRDYILYILLINCKALFSSLYVQLQMIVLKNQ